MSERRWSHLASLIPPDEMKRVMESDSSAEIDPSHLTCLDYRVVAKLIPLHWTVIDFGCSYNAQSYYFKKHQRLISVDLPYHNEMGWHFERFSPPWSEIYVMSINEWMDAHLNTLDLDETFAICGWVPSPIQVERVRAEFKNVLTIYPSNKAWYADLRRQKD